MATTIKIGSPRRSTLVVGVFKDSKSTPRGVSDLSDAARKAVNATIARPDFRGEVGEVAAANDETLIVGLGSKGDLKAATFETIGARLVKALQRMQIGGATLAIAEVVPARIADATTIGRNLAIGMQLAAWKVDFYRGAGQKDDGGKNGELKTLTVTAADNDCRAGLKDGHALGDCANYTRRIGATPPNICNPAWIASEAKKMAKAVGLTCRVISYAEAQKQGMGGLVNVGKGSEVKPRLIILEHKPAKAKKDVKVALVGKTITYDTGGYSLKISNSMKGMKYDKLGGCAILGAIRAIAMLKVPVHTVALLPAAENMVSGDAYRPDDIIEMYNKVTVEVTNTDAEGRLVLADALAYACKTIKPTHIIDAATLTGGVVVALGHFCAGVFSTDDGLFRTLEQASEASNEKIWRLPLWDDHRDFMRAKHADIWNSAPSRNAHPIQGAAFLDYFVDKDVPWAHIDIAGVGDVESDKEPYVQGPTGWGVRLITEAVRSMA